MLWWRQCTVHVNVKTSQHNWLDSIKIIGLQLVEALPQLVKPEVHHLIHKNLSHIPVLRHMNPIHDLQSYFFKILWIQGIHKRMVRFQKLTRNLFLTLHGQNVHRQQRQLLCIPCIVPFTPTFSKCSLSLNFPANLVYAFLFFVVHAMCSASPFFDLIGWTNHEAPHYALLSPTLLLLRPSPA